jgi:hypothetical protein
MDWRRASGFVTGMWRIVSVLGLRAQRGDWGRLEIVREELFV